MKPLAEKVVRTDYDNPNTIDQMIGTPNKSEVFQRNPVILG